MYISQAREELQHREVQYRQSDGSAPLEVGNGNKCGVQLTHGSYWAPLKQLKDLFCLEHCPCPAAESTGSTQGGSGVCAGPAQQLGMGGRKDWPSPWLRTAPGAGGMCLPNRDSSCTQWAAGTDGDTQLCV